MLSFGQTQPNQKELLDQLVGNWESSSDNYFWKLDGEKIGDLAVQLSIYELKNNQEVLIATEMYTYDKWLNNILSFGTNNKSQAYKGRGKFTSTHCMEMKNIDSHNTLFSNVSFTFQKDSLVMTILPSGAKNEIRINFKPKK